jgi:hypothetical protein
VKALKIFLLNDCLRFNVFLFRPAEDKTTMTIAYGFGFDFVRPRSRRARIARIDALATLLDSALVIPSPASASPSTH